MHVKFGSVTDLVGVFGECLSALAPLVTKVGIEWREPKNYDDWDAIASAIYSSIVAKTVAYTVEGELFNELTPYAIIMSEYRGASFLYSTEFGREAVFMKLVSSESPFDTAL